MCLVFIPHMSARAHFRILIIDAAYSHKVYNDEGLQCAFQMVLRNKICPRPDSCSPYRNRLASDEWPVLPFIIATSWCNLTAFRYPSDNLFAK